jgi:hypothetical protein
MGNCSGSGSGEAEGIGRQLGEDACRKCELLHKKRTLAGSGLDRICKGGLQGESELLFGSSRVRGCLAR